MSNFPLRRWIVGALLVVLAACSSSPPAGSSPSPTRDTPSPTFTTSSPSPTAEPPASGPIGYVGCSNSAGSVNGYHLAGGTQMWPYIRNYGGGTVTQWATGIGQKSNQYWSAFTKQFQNSPAQVFWLQLCARVDENQDDAADQALAIIAEIHRFAPDAVIYVSALNDWVAPHVCAICGPQGPENMQAEAAQVVASGAAKKGPRMPALLTSCTARECGVSSAGATSRNNEVEPDGCHPNEAGQLSLGEALVRFFG
jgi:hypothetical protein